MTAMPMNLDDVAKFEREAQAQLDSWPNCDCHECHASHVILSLARAIHARDEVIAEVEREALHGPFDSIGAITRLIADARKRGVVR